MTRRSCTFLTSGRSGKACSAWMWFVVLALVGWVCWAVPGCAQQLSAEADSAAADVPVDEAPAIEPAAPAAEETLAVEPAAPAAEETLAVEPDPQESEAQQAAEEEDEDEAEMQRQIEEAMRAYQERLQAEAEARAKDPAWQPSHEQVAVIEVSQDGEPAGVQNYCLGPDGNLLVCWGTGGVQMVLDEETDTWEMKPMEGSSEIRIISPEGEKLGKWELDFQPQAICVHTDGTIFVGGQGHLARLDAQGRVLATADSPAVVKPPAAQVVEEEPAEGEEGETSEQTEEPAQTRSVVDALLSALGMGPSSAEPVMSPEDEARMRAYQQRRRLAITGLAVSRQDLFVACPMREGYGYAVWRMDHEFQNPKLIVENLRGCCGQMDVQSRDGNLWVPENARHRVTCYDREGNVLRQFGRRDRKAADGFGGCCEPKNMRFAPDGTMYLAESGPPVAIKRFTREGEFLGVVGLPVFKTGCVRVTVEVAGDGRMFILSPRDGKIYVLAPKEETGEEAS